MAKSLQDKSGSQEAIGPNGKVQKKITELPPSSDKEFWGEDAEIVLIDTNKPEAAFEAREGHDWKQQGPYIVCRSCPLEHSIYIGIDKELIGFDKKGRPKFRKIALNSSNGN